jgi:hypothetical protein
MQHKISTAFATRTKLHTTGIASFSRNALILRVFSGIVARDKAKLSSSQESFPGNTAQKKKVDSRA